MVKGTTSSNKDDNNDEGDNGDGDNIGVRIAKHNTPVELMPMVPPRVQPAGLYASGRVLSNPQITVKNNN